MADVPLRKNKRERVLMGCARKRAAPVKSSVVPTAGTDRLTHQARGDAFTTGNGFKNFRCARILLSGIELMHMIAKGQMKGSGIRYTPAEQFSSASCRYRDRTGVSVFFIV